MGREANLEEARRAAFIERLLGDPKPFHVYDQDGCPKCGNRSVAPKVDYCFGKQILNPDNHCPVLGEHLHCLCKCGNAWLERCRDWQPEEGEAGP